MNAAQVKTLLDRPVAFHRSLVPIAGSVNAALLLSQALYWTNRTNDEAGWFHKSQEEWEEETGLTRREQETARERLRAAGVWEEVRRGLPARLYFRVDLDHLSSLLGVECNAHKNGASVQSRVTRSATPVCTKAPDLTARISQTLKEEAETTTETTSENSEVPTPAPADGHHHNDPLIAAKLFFNQNRAVFHRCFGISIGKPQLDEIHERLSDFIAAEVGMDAAMLAEAEANCWAYVREKAREAGNPAPVRFAPNLLFEGLQRVVDSRRAESQRAQSDTGGAAEGEAKPYDPMDYFRQNAARFRHVEPTNGRPYHEIMPSRFPHEQRGLVA